MVNRPKQIGTAAETAVTRYARTNGFGGADRRALAGNADVGDVLLCPGVILEVKGGETAHLASDNLVWHWLVETERERVNAGAAVALLVTKRKGMGPARAGDWWCHMRLRTLLQLDAALYEHPATFDRRQHYRHVPIRMTFGDALTVLRAAGYGDPLEAVAR